MKGSFSLST